MLTVRRSLLLVAVAECHDATGVNWEERPALLQTLEVSAVPPNSTAVPRPTSVTVGTPLQIMVASGGSSSCTRPGPVTPRANDSQLLLDVRDFWAVGAEACTDDLILYQRTLFHTFFSPGEKTIRAMGEGEDLIYQLDVVD